MHFLYALLFARNFSLIKSGCYTAAPEEIVEEEAPVEMVTEQEAPVAHEVILADA
jgi:hypothetical protein